MIAYCTKGNRTMYARIEVRIGADKTGTLCFVNQRHFIEAF